MTDAFHIEELEEHLGDHKIISIDELHQFYKEEEPDLKRSTLRWRIYELVNKGILQRVKRGVYTLKTGKREWKPEITEDLKKIYASVHDEFPYLEFCVWSTRWLVPYSHHLPVGYLTLLDAEKDTEESVFHFITNNFKIPTLVKPEIKEINTYIDWNRDNIIIRTLISQSPLMETDGIRIPKLEKIIIDLFKDEVVFGSFQGRELKIIYQNLFNDYMINEGTLKRYALRRNKWEGFKNHIRRWGLDEHLTEV